MASFLAARRFGGAGANYLFKGGLLATATAGAATSFHWLDNASSDCEAAATKSPKTAPVNVKTRMTLIGRFSLESETDTNPSIPTFFIGLAGATPFTAQRFAQLWHDRGMEQLHPRFHSRVSTTHKGYFEPTPELQIRDALPPMVYREDLKRRVQSCLTLPLQVTDSLWQVQISSGSMGSSGAIPKIKAARLVQPFESILLFRGHHALADGVSLTAAFSDLCDEAQELRKAVKSELQRRRGSRTFLQKLARYLKTLLWLCFGSTRAVLNHVYLLLFTPSNPFESLESLLQTSNATVGRTVSWCDAAPLVECKRVARSMGPSVTVNDVMVSCVTYAVAKQLEQHRQRLAATAPDNTTAQKLHSTINVVIPVHLGGGVLLPGQSVGNNIGAFCASVPGEQECSAASRLEKVHNSLYTIKRTPAPLLSYLAAKMASTLPSGLTKRLFRSSHAHACVAVTNNKGSPSKLHLDGQPIETMAGFLPLPPGIPIGVSITSYCGTISLSVTAEPWAVPNSDQFLKWMLEEYTRLLKHADSIAMPLR